MSNIAWSIVIALLCILFYGVVPALIVWGWVRWARRKQPRELFAVLSLVAFVLATASAVLATSSVLYARAIGGFPFYDPRLMRIFRWGFLLSLGALGFAIGGVWRPSALRWHALVCAIGTAFFWVATAEGE